MNDRVLEGFRLSPQQKHLWLLQQGSPPARFCGQCRLDFEGDLDGALLRAALAEVVERHEILRTSFRSLADVALPLQVIGAAYVPRVAEYDLTGAPADRQPQLLARLLEETRRDFTYEPEHGPPLQAALVRRSPRHHTLILGLPALCADALSLAFLGREIVSCYQSLRQREPLADAGTQYVELAEWLNQLLESPATKTGREYWRKHAHRVGPVPLPFANGTEGPGEFRPQTVSFLLDPGLTADLTALARERGARVADVLLTCWHLLLSRLAETRDITIGTLFNGRKYEELEGALGLFARHLPFASAASAGDSLVEAVKETQERVRGLAEYQDYYSFEELHPEGRDPEYPLFCFEYIEQAVIAPAGELQVTLRGTDSWINKFLLKMVCEEAHGTLEVRLHHDAHRLQRAAVSRLGHQFLTLVGDALRRPEVPLADLSLVDAAEHHRLVVEFNQTQVDYGPAICVHELIADRARRAPDAIAVAGADQWLSYGGLEQRSARLAAALQARGVEPEARVALCIERSVDFVVGLLAVMKTGGAYVPVDPAQPRERLALILEDAGARLLLTSRGLAAVLAGLPAEVHSVEDLLEEEQSGAAARTVLPEQLVYVMFTSGSTGRPKGVAVEHRQLTHYVRAIRDRLDLEDGASFAMVSTVGADLGNTSVFAALCGGGCLHILSEAQSFEPTELAACLEERGIDGLKIVPCHLQGLCDVVGVERVLPRRWLIVGGEALEPRLARAILADQPPCQLINHYGPTESTVGVLAGAVNAASGAADPAVTLGRPLPNAEALVLDASLQPAPIGVPGELWIGGAGLARGYLGNPEQTAASFRPHPFASRPGARLYRTGDRARVLESGEFTYLGRVDEQVKVRGYRIELGEIQAVLEQLAGVHQAVVICQSNSRGDQRLVGYVVPEERGAAGSGFAAGLRAELQERLPDYMIPALVPLPAMPLTANGKVDRQALRPVAESGSERYVAPRTPAEQTLAGIWADMLGVDQIGVHDNFFERGGHSLLAMQVIVRVREAFQVDASLRDLFENPTVSGLATVLQRAERSRRIPPIERISRDQELPLSFGQQRLWFVDQLIPGNAFYNLAGAVRLSGPLDRAALDRALGEIVRRHEVLRTTFTAQEGRAVQCIAPRLELVIPLIDLSGLPEPVRESVARDLASAEAARPFDLQRGPLLRATLLQRGEAEHTILATLHHIVGDGWSRGVFIREIATLYGAYVHGLRPPLEPLPVQYADYAHWQRDWLQGEVLEELLGYWREQLAGLPALSLPTDRPRPAIQSFHGARQPLVYPAELADSLRALSRAEGVTMFMTILAAFQVLLSRYSGQQDVAVGTAIAGRIRPELEGLIGCFINNLVLRTELQGDQGFRQLLARTRDVCLGAFAHQELPFEKLVDEVQPQRDLSREPLFQVMLVLQNVPVPKLEIPGALTLRPQEFATETAKFDVSLVLWEGVHGISGFLEYKTDLFEASTMARMGDHLGRVLKTVADDPDDPINRVAYLSAAEARQLTAEWSHPEGDDGSFASVPEQFAARLRETPDALAVAWGTEQLTYAGLNWRAQRLAGMLQARGVGPEVPVGLCVERSVDLIVGMLGILQSGGVYVPLNPALPEERLAFLLADTGTPLVLSRRDVQFPEGVALPARLDLDTPFLFAGGAVQDGTPDPVVQPAQLAYVIYTSGSTGLPKGTLLTHAGMGNLARLQAQTFRLGPQDRVLQFAPQSYDASVWEIVMALTSGACLVLAGRDAMMPGAQLTQLFQEEGITICTLPPSILPLMAPTGLEALHTLVAAGEACAAELVDTWSPGRRFFNAYGPTETTVCASYHLCAAGEETVPPIGRPVTGSRLYVLDPEFNPVPIGVPGELLVGGTLLARGYLGQPAVTAERFVPEPYSATPGARLYRTGDLARWRKDGNLEFLGRLDQQVKVHGFRIEPGEIESALMEIPAVAQAVVIAREDRPGDRRLVAYLVVDPAAGSSPGVASLRAHLGQKLPDHMVPATYVSLEALPLTVSGKVDRRALPAPEGLRPELNQVFVAPRTALEAELAGLWCEVLGLDRAGVHDNFFELGGDSILSIQVVARASRAGLQLTPAQMFQHQTIAELATVVGTVEKVEAEQGLVTGEVPLTPIQHWFFEQDLPAAHHWNMALFFEVKEELDAAELYPVMAALLRQHDALRLRFTRGASGWVQHNAGAEAADPGEVIVQIDVGALDESLQKRAVEAAAAQVQLSLDLERGPLMRLALIHRGGGSGRLLLVTHHLVIDGVSWRILQEDLMMAYEQRRRGQPIQLLPKTTSFRRWSERLALHAGSAALASERAYWEDLATADWPSPPRDLEAGPNISASAETVVVALTPEATQALLKEAPQAYRTQINDLLLTALVEGLEEWLGEPRVLLELEGHGRETLFTDCDVTRTVGWFTSLYPVGLDLREVEGPGERLKAVKEQLRAVPQRGIGHGLLRYLDPGTSLAGRGAAISFNYFGQLDRELPGEGPYGPAPEYAGPLHATSCPRPYLLSLTSMIVGGQLTLRWTFSRNLHQRATIERLAARFREALLDLIEHCQQRSTAEWTPSDFPLARLDEEEMARVADLLDRLDDDEEPQVER